MPRTEQVVCVREPDVRPLVVGEVEIVGPERILDPVGDTNHRRTLDVLADAGMQVGCDDRGVQEAFDSHAGGGCLGRKRSLGPESGLGHEPDDSACQRHRPTSSHHARFGHGSDSHRRTETHRTTPRGDLSKVVHLVRRHQEDDHVPDRGEVLP